MGAVLLDTVSLEAAWMAHDANVPSAEATYTYLGTPTGEHPASFVATDRFGFMLFEGRAGLHVKIDPYSSERDPTRTLTFSTTGAVLTDTTNDLTEAYDFYGRLVERRFRTGDPILGVTYFNDRTDHIERIVDPTGSFVSFQYANGKLQSVSDPAGHTTTFNIDGAGDLASFTEPDGETYTFTYEAHRMKTKRSPKGDLTQYSYSSGRTPVQPATGLRSAPAA
jgi:YD repeat-containing protein